MRTIWVASLLAAQMPVGVTYAHAGDFGKSEYMKSCAACHGVSGKGDGHAAKTLTKSPPDLTRLSADNKGAFPLARTYDVIDGRIDVVVHGPREMPVWGNVFKRDVISRTSRGYMSDDMAEAMGHKKILEIIEYLMTLQGR
jgi:mono/diheme cytochrome c family protein